MTGTVHSLCGLTVSNSPAPDAWIWPCHKISRPEEEIDGKWRKEFQKGGCQLIRRTHAHTQAQQILWLVVEVIYWMLIRKKWYGRKSRRFVCEGGGRRNYEVIKSNKSTFKRADKSQKDWGYLPLSCQDWLMATAATWRHVTLFEPRHSLRAEWWVKLITGILSQVWLQIQTCAVAAWCI